MPPQVPVGRLPLLIAGLVVAAVLGGLAVTSTMQVSGLRRQLEQKERAFQALQAEHQTLQRQLGGIEQERGEFEQRLDALRGQLTSSAHELQQLRTAFSALQINSDVLEAENARLEKRVARLMGERDDASSRLQELEQHKDTLERASTRLRERLAMAERDYQALSEKLESLQAPSFAQAAFPAAENSGAVTLRDVPPAEPAVSIPASQAVQLPPIVVRKDRRAADAPLSARVVEANEPHRFVVLDKGEAQGVKAGMAFDLFRAGELIGRAVATRVRPQLTACEVQGSRSLGFPQPGDTARERTP
ncbi:MAG: hypothetical protein HYY15_04295 [Candidatus Omnitrophica bacterium]|nr:hypothetical protein [Candidatus Omnitrophota bacterium]